MRSNTKVRRGSTCFRNGGSEQKLRPGIQKAKNLARTKCGLTEKHWRPGMDDAKHVASYDGLKGASGRRVYYRAERFDPKHLFIGKGPDTFVDGQLHRLINLSMSGIATLDQTDSHSEQDVGRVVPIELRIENTPLHEGHGEIVRVEKNYAGSKVALRLTDHYLNIERLTSQYREHILKRELARGRTDRQSELSKEYRLLCSDALHLLRRYRLILSEWETKNRNDRQDPRYGREMLDLATEQILPQWRHLSETANVFIDDFMKDPELLTIAKEYTELVLSPEMQVGPIWRRSYEKPLGYPGDYQVMQYVYSWQDEGDTLYGKMVHRLGLNALECVAARMSMIQQIIGQEMLNIPGSGQINITNLACGAAQETVNYLSQGHLLRPVRFTLIDQDKDALSFAYEQTFPHAIRHNGQVRLHCLHCSFTDLMNGGPLANDLPPQHLIYSVGLFDYLKARRAESLIQSLYSDLKPGGLLVIGNLKLGPKAGRWAAEMICDWTMFYRTEQEMRDLAKSIPSKNIELRSDRTDRVYLLCIRKPK